MADYAHKKTDKEIDKLKRKLAKEYQEASRGIEKKLNQHWADFNRKDAKKRKQLQDGIIDEAEYNRWRQGQISVGGRWEDMRRTLAEDMTNVDNIARKMVDRSREDVFALNGNFASYQIERQASIDMGFTLYNHDSVARLMRDNPDVLPPLSRYPENNKVKEAIRRGEIVAWQEGQLQSAVTQGIMQGMSIPELSHYIADNLSARNYSSAVRYARTAMTEAQNAGRYDAYRRATNLGVNLTIEWMATLDRRTRHTHRMMHGERRKVDEPFEVDGKEILYPGYPEAPQELIWNCRCTLASWVEGYEPETVKSAPGLGDMTFEEWQREKAPKKNNRSEDDGDY